MKKTLITLACLALLVPASSSASTLVPGHADRYDGDGNGFPDAGEVVNGRYSDTYTYGSAVCKVTVTYRGDYGNTAYLDSGVISNHYVCKGDGQVQTFNYQVVHKTDPRYTGNPEWSTWGDWEYHVLTQGGQGNEAYGGNGNLVRPYSG